MLIKFVEIDLKQPLQPIYLDARYTHLFVLVYWGYLPLGLLKLVCQSPSRLFTAKELKSRIIETLGWQVWQQAVVGGLNKLDKRSEDSLPPISVIVCTRDRPLSLERCLKALTRLDYTTYEVIVVDNCSQNPAVAQVVAQSGFRYVREDRPGLDWARNRGIREAKYDVIAYVDDDALATPGWLRGVALGFEDPEIMAVTGMVLPAEIETVAQSDFEQYGGMGKGFTTFTICREKLRSQAEFWASNWGVGANMAFRRALFEAIGEFDIALDVGTPTNGGGDIEFFYRTVAAGYSLRYEPAALIYHVHRRSHAALMRQIYNNGRSFAAYLMTIARRHPQRRAAVGWFALRWWGVGWLLRRLIIGIVKRDREMLRLSLTELSGCLSSFNAYRKAQRIAASQLSAELL